jgi:uroporphyrinogen III methyltransferase/synthase
MNKVLKIGTRKSKLALIQTDIVKNKLLEIFPELKIEIVKMETQGDLQLERSLSSFGGKGVFTKELEEALLTGKIDLAVHSAKDLPMEFPKGLDMVAVLNREDERDVIVTCDGTKLKDLPDGAVLGTSSLRRELQAKQMNPHITVKTLRGNVQTRLSKLKNREYDAIVMAAAGMKRAGLDQDADIFMEYMDPDEFLPAAGQGILCVEGRAGDLKELTEAIHEKQAEIILTAERSFLKKIQCGCNAPAAVHTTSDGTALTVRAMYAKDGNNPVYTEVTGSVLEADDLGRKAGEQLC